MMLLLSLTVALLLELVSLSQGYGFSCQPNAVYTSQNVQFRCCQVGQSWQNVPQGCVDEHGLLVPVGETRIRQVPAGQLLAFQYRCEQKTPGTLVYRPVACALMSDLSNLIQPGGKFVHNQFEFECQQQGDSLHAQPVACLLGSSRLTSGQTGNRCSQPNVCANYQCSITGLQAEMTCQNCNIGGNVTLVGGSCSFGQQQCYCSSAGSFCYGFGK